MVIWVKESDTAKGLFPIGTLPLWIDPETLTCKKCSNAGHSTTAHDAKYAYLNTLTDQEDSSSDKEAILESKARKISTNPSRGRQSNKIKSLNKRKSRSRNTSNNSRTSGTHHTDQAHILQMEVQAETPLTTEAETKTK